MEAISAEHSTQWGVKHLLASMLLLSVVATSVLAQTDTRTQNGKGWGHLIYFQLPPDVSRNDVVAGSQRVKNRLHKLVREQLFSAESHDLSVIFVDYQGLPILPDLDAAKGRHRPQVARLTFSYNSTEFPWSETELNLINGALADFYPLAAAIYGNPAFANTVNVRKDPTLSVSGLYYVSSNEIVIRGATEDNLDVLCHEMIHAFRDDLLIELSTFEEGMTRAAEVEVFDHLPSYNYWDRSHGYTYDVYYEGLNIPVIGSAQGIIPEEAVETLLRYQLAGYAWAKVLLENPRFLSNFNERFYNAATEDPSTTYTEALLVTLAERVQNNVEGEPFRSWYTHQGVLNSSPAQGYFLYHRINQFMIDFFMRDGSGAEYMQPAATIDWTIYDCHDTQLASGSGVTNGYGWLSIPELQGYTGRIRVAASASSTGGIVTASAFRPVGNEVGVFGVVEDSNSGTMTITPLSGRSAAVKVDVVNGAFFAPALASTRGRFRAVFEDTQGKRRSRYFTKDASDYYLRIGPQ